MSFFFLLLILHPTVWIVNVMAGTPAVILDPEAKVFGGRVDAV